MATLVKIGNSRGVRIPKNLVEQLQFMGKRFTLEMRKDGLLIKPDPHPRAGWDEAFLKAQKQGKGKKDPGLLEDMLNQESDMKDWEWEW